MLLAKLFHGKVNAVAHDYALGYSGFGAQPLKRLRLCGCNPGHHLNFLAFYHGLDFQLSEPASVSSIYVQRPTETQK